MIMISYVFIKPYHIPEKHLDFPLFPKQVPRYQLWWPGNKLLFSTGVVPWQVHMFGDHTTGVVDQITQSVLFSMCLWWERVVCVLLCLIWLDDVQYAIGHLSQSVLFSIYCKSIDKKEIT